MRVGIEKKHERLHNLLKAVSAEYTDNMALADSNKSYTYGELYQHASAAAYKLYRQGVRPGNRVVYFARKEAASIIVFWGILLAGGIPVILDYEDGPAENETKIRQVAADVIISDYTDVLPSLNDLASPVMHEVAHPAICYMLLTSGSTGVPKAVQVSHQNVLHYTYAVYERLGCPRNVVAAHVSTFAADLGLTGLLVALVSGGVLRICTKEEATDPRLFADIVNREKVSLLKITPSHLGSLLFDMQHLLTHRVENIVCGGEKMPWELVKRVFRSGVCSNLYNHYGPTETTVGALMYKTDPFINGNTASVPIGMPLGETICFTENDTGELYIGGPGVSHGYFNNKQEQEKRFVTRDINGKTVCFYRTGDICKKLHDGNFEFLYRTDRQVKARGYRVEPGEIELVLTSHPGIENANVVLSEHEAHGGLEAYIKCINGQSLGEKQLRSWLAERLPSYKIPSTFHFYTAIPYNANGKIDINALKNQFRKSRSAGNGQAAEPGHDNWEQAVSDSWASLLKGATIDAADNFFETGGDSLLAIQLIGRLQRYGYNIHIRDLNNNPVFSDFVSLQPARSINGGEAVVKQKQAMLTCSQLNFFRQNEFDHNRYCQSILLETTGKINPGEMALAFSYVLQNHAQLTTFFNTDATTGGDNWLNTGIGVSVIDINKPTIIQIQAVADKLLRTISIEQAKLAAAHVFIDPQGRYYLYLVFHHLVIDVISWNIIIEELLDYYAQLLRNQSPAIIPENTINNFYGQLRHNRAILPPPVKLPARPLHRLPQPGNQEVNPKTVVKVRSLTLPDSMSAVLHRHIADKRFSALSGFLLSALSAALMKELNLLRITIDIEFHGRPQHSELPDLSRSVSWWATTLPVDIEYDRCGPYHCADLLDAKTAEANTINIHAGAYAATQHKADVRFNYLGNFPATYENAFLQLEPSSFNAGPTRSWPAQQEYLLYFTSRFIGSSCIIDIQYHTGWFPETTISRLVRAIFSLLKKYLDDNGRNALASLAMQNLESNMPSVGQPMYRLNNTKDISSAAQKVILLTGATGFLGIYLLKELLNDERVIVYCIVRAATREDAEKRLADTFMHYFGNMPDDFYVRVRILKGNLLLKDFGLGAAFEQIAAEATTILHAAADTNLMKDYWQLTDANIAATANIIRFANTGNSKELHYVSTLAVSGYSTTGSRMRFAEDNFESGQSFVSDYEKTKFEAERIVREYFSNGGKGKIYRTGHIAADSVRGKFQQNIDKNRIFQVIKGILLLGKVPSVYEEEIAFSYVDVVAQAMVGFCTGNFESPLPCLHIENPVALPITRIIDMLKKAGYEMTKVDMDAFRKSVAGFEGTAAEKNTVDIAHIWIQRYIDFPRNINYVHSKSVDTLARFGLYFPQTNLAWFKAMLMEGINTGYLPSNCNLSKETSLQEDL
jgi:amino acid adenylation domain-containing protein/thioester reductase-like protein